MLVGYDFLTLIESSSFRGIINFVFLTLQHKVVTHECQHLKMMKLKRKNIYSKLQVSKEVTLFKFVS